MDNKDAMYIYNTRKLNMNFSMMFSLFERREESGTNDLTLKNTESNESQFKGLILTHNLTDKRFSERDLMREKERLERMMPQFYHLIDFSSWQQNSTVRNVQSDIVIAFPEEALKSLPKLSAKEVHRRFSQFSTGAGIPDDIYEQNLADVSRIIAKFLDSNLPIETRLEKYQSLRYHREFKDYVPGFLMSLYPEDVLLKVIEIDVRMSSTNGHKVRFSHGDPAVLKVYRQFNILDNHTNGENLKLKLEMELLDQLEGL